MNFRAIIVVVILMFYDRFSLLDWLTATCIIPNSALYMMNQSGENEFRMWFSGWDGEYPFKGTKVSLLEIVDAQGKLVMHQEVGDGDDSFNISHLTKGIYLIRLQTGKGIISEELIIHYPYKRKYFIRRSL